MNARTARQILRAYRWSGEDDHEREVRAALKEAERNPGLKEEFQAQLEFDRACAKSLDRELPADLLESLEAKADALEAKAVRRSVFRDPAIFTVAIAFLVLVAFGVWVLLGQLDTFSGLQELEEVARIGDSSNMNQFEPLETTAGTLDDWFVMKEFDGFVVPPGFEDAPVVGVRILNYENQPIAVAAVAEPRSFFYVFDAHPFSFSLPEGEWRVVEYPGGHVLAATQIGNRGFMITMKGSRDEMERFLSRK